MLSVGSAVSSRPEGVQRELGAGTIGCVTAAATLVA